MAESGVVLQKPETQNQERSTGLLILEREEFLELRSILREGYQKIMTRRKYRTARETESQTRSRNRRFLLVLIEDEAIPLDPNVRTLIAISDPEREEFLLELSPRKMEYLRTVMNYVINKNDPNVKYSNHLFPVYKKRETKRGALKRKRDRL